MQQRAQQASITNARKRLGEMLIDEGLLSRDQLEEALVGQREEGIKLGQYLIQKGVVEEKHVVRILGLQLRIDVFHKEKYPPDTRLAIDVDEQTAHRHNLVPLKKTGSLIYVGMMDPTDMGAIDLIMKTTKLDVEPVICTEQQYISHFYAIYGKMLAGIADVDVEAEEGVTVEDSTFTISSLQYMAQDAPVVKLVNSVLVQALDKRASDIHIQPEQDRIYLRFRVDGKLEEAPAPPKAFFLPFISRVKLLSNMDISVSRIPQDGRFTYRTRDREISVRTSTTPSIYGEKVVLRLLDQSGDALSISQLGMDPAQERKIERATMKPFGMILATGPTGSGKTTLLYSILKRINTPEINIVTLEDPVEYRVKGVCQIQLNRKAGMTFANGLRSILRQDPDVIMVGEIRDSETADIAIKSSLTGHKVLSTLHTNDAPDSITRLLEMGVEPFLISSTLLVCVAQRLVRRLCRDCAQEFEPPAEMLKMMGVKPAPGLSAFKAVGCPRCRNTGYFGRIGIFEVLEMDQAVKELVLGRASSNEIKRRVVQAGSMETLKRNAARKVLEGVTTFEEFLTLAYDR